MKKEFEITSNHKLTITLIPKICLSSVALFSSLFLKVFHFRQSPPHLQFNLVSLFYDFQGKKNIYIYFVLAQQSTNNLITARLCEHVRSCCNTELTEAGALICPMCLRNGASKDELELPFHYVARECAVTLETCEAGTIQVQKSFKLQLKPINAPHCQKLDRFYCSLHVIAPCLRVLNLHQFAGCVTGSLIRLQLTLFLKLRGNCMAFVTAALIDPFPSELTWRNNPDCRSRAVR